MMTHKKLCDSSTTEFLVRGAGGGMNMHTGREQKTLGVFRGYPYSERIAGEICFTRRQAAKFLNCAPCTLVKMAEESRRDASAKKMRVVQRTPGAPAFYPCEALYQFYLSYSRR
jgi:hypothetical protein